MRLCKTLDEVKGHKPIIKWFKKCLSEDNLPQVILIDGVPGIGKSTIAKIIACEIACKDTPDKLSDYKKSVIEEDKSTPGVRLSFGVSNIKRKVIIMDEAHGMTQEQQDSLLVAFESLQLGIYIIICTTDASSLGEAFMSRCIRRRLNGLTEPEIHSLIRERIRDNRLSFDMNLNFVVKVIAAYTGNEPRRAINLLDSFKQGTLVTSEELETFVNIYEGRDVLILTQYLYSGEIMNGLKFIRNMDMTSTFVGTLLEVVRIVYGDISIILSRDEALKIEEVTKSDGGRRLLDFAVGCSTCARLTRNLMSGYFLKYCKKSDYSEVPVRVNDESTKYKDIALMNKMIDKSKISKGVNTEIEDIGINKSLEELFELSDNIR